MASTLRGGLAAYLQTVQPYAGWSERTHTALASASVLSDYASGAVLQHAGTLAKSVYLLYSGAVEISTPVAAGHRHCIGFIFPGALVGAPAMLNPDLLTQDWTAASRVKAWRIPRETFVACFWEDRQMASTIVMTMTAWLRRLADAAAHWVHLEAHGRVAYALLMVSEAFDGRGFVRDTGLRITHAKLAEMTGLTRQSVGTALRTLRDQGLVSLESRLVVVHSPAGLKALIDNPQ